MSRDDKVNKPNTLQICSFETCQTITKMKYNLQKLETQDGVWVTAKPLIMVFQTFGFKILEQTCRLPENFYEKKCLIRNATLASKHYQQFLTSKTVDLNI